MDKYEIDYYDLVTNTGNIFYFMEGFIPNRNDEKTHLLACINPDKYASEGFIEDENGMYYDEQLSEEACFQALRDAIIDQAQIADIDINSLYFTRIRVSRDEVCEIRDI